MSDGSIEACSNRSSTWARSRERVVHDFRGKACSSHAGTPNVAMTAPAASTRSSYAERRPAVVWTTSGRQIDRRHPGHAHGHVALAPEDAAHRVGDVVGVESGRGHLVQERLEGVEVVGVDHDHVDGLLAAAPCADREPAEPGPDHDDPMTSATRRGYVGRPESCEGIHELG